VENERELEISLTYRPEQMKYNDSQQKRGQRPSKILEWEVSWKALASPLAAMGGWGEG
jgi:hypothetical protein